MATCHGKKGGATCGRPVLKCGKCSAQGCSNKGCDNCKFPGGKCAVCGTSLPMSFFSRMSAMFGRRGD
ncbi:MAG: hypothetical protein ACOZAA_07970 [Pseudomonadota bacterium]